MVTDEHDECFPVMGMALREPLGEVGILRLRKGFASRCASLAQDDRGYTGEKDLWTGKRSG